MISPSRNVVKDYEDKNKKSVLRTGAKALNFLSQRCTNVCVGYRYWAGGAVLGLHAGTTPIVCLLNARYYAGSVLFRLIISLLFLFFVSFIITVYIRIVVLFYFKKGQ